MSLTDIVSLGSIRELPLDFMRNEKPALILTYQDGSFRVDEKTGHLNWLAFKKDENTIHYFQQASSSLTEKPP